MRRFDYVSPFRAALGYFGVALLCRVGYAVSIVENLSKRTALHQTSLSMIADFLSSQHPGVDRILSRRHFHVFVDSKESRSIHILIVSSPW